MSSSGVSSLESFYVITANGLEKIENEVLVVSDNKELTFTVNGLGWGHGVGMSQYGAVGMAKAGFGYQEIIEHYFKGTTIE